MLPIAFFFFLDFALLRRYGRKSGNPRDLSASVNPGKEAFIAIETKLFY